MSARYNIQQSVTVLYPDTTNCLMVCCVVLMSTWNSDKNDDDIIYEVFSSLFKVVKLLVFRRFSFKGRLKSLTKIDDEKFISWTKWTWNCELLNKNLSAEIYVDYYNTRIL